MKKLQINKSILFRVISLAALTISFLIPINKAYAISCSNGKPPVSKADCVFGPCAVCEDKNSTWDNPRLEVRYVVFGLFETHRSITYNDRIIKSRNINRIHNCNWLAMIRFCVRGVIPGTKEEGNLQNRFGNKTGATDNPRPQLCAYEDWMDGMDTTFAYNPHYHMEKNTGAMSIGETAAIGAAAGVPGVILGSIIGAIMAHWNHVVPTDIGCVDRPIAVGPPVFSNDAWNTTYLPRPFIDNAVDSTFLKPMITLSFCQDPDTKELLDCVKDESNKLINVVQTLTLSPVEANKYDDRKSASVSYTEGAQTKTDDREFSARISTDDPSEICVYKTKEVSSTISASGVNVFQGCVPRPGYMPLPKILSVVGAQADKISVSFEGAPEKIELWPNPRNFDPAAVNDPGNECKTLHQITFCIIKKCISRSPSVVTTSADGTQITTPGSCLTWDEQACLVGYDTAPVVLAKAPVNGLDGIDGAPIPVAGPPLGNVSKSRGVPFVNVAANPEMIAGVVTPSSITPRKPLLVYEPKQCYEKDDTGKCINYDGKCDKKDSDGTCIKYVNNVTKDPYFIDVGSNDPVTGKFIPAQQVIRQVSASELDLCTTPGLWIKKIPGTYNYTTPAGCKKIDVELWGAGGGGIEGGQNDFSGGGGGYIKASVPTSSGETFTVQVGRGGAPRQKGGDSVSSGKVIAYGGSPRTGGSAKCSGGATCPPSNIKPGNNGYRRECGLMIGAGSWNPDTGKYEQWLTAGPYSGAQQCDANTFPDLDFIDITKVPLDTSISNYRYPPVTGVGGCSSDKCSDNSYKRNLGVGGHGKARITCSQYQ